MNLMNGCQRLLRTLPAAAHANPPLSTLRAPINYPQHQQRTTAVSLINCYVIYYTRATIRGGRKQGQSIG